MNFGRHKGTMRVLSGFLGVQVLTWFIDRKGRRRIMANLLVICSLVSAMGVSERGGQGAMAMASPMPNARPAGTAIWQWLAMNARGTESKATMTSSTFD